MAKVKNSCGGTTCVIDPVVPVQSDVLVNVRVMHGTRLFLGEDTYMYPLELAVPDEVYQSNKDKLELI